MPPLEGKNNRSVVESSRTCDLRCSIVYIDRKKWRMFASEAVKNLKFAVILRMKPNWEIECEKS